MRPRSVRATHRVIAPLLCQISTIDICHTAKSSRQKFAGSLPVAIVPVDRLAFVRSSGDMIRDRPHGRFVTALPRTRVSQIEPVDPLVRPYLQVIFKFTSRLSSPTVTKRGIHNRHLCGRFRKEIQRQNLHAAITNNSDSNKKFMLRETGIELQLEAAPIAAG
jgi:hypothetical protein